MKTENDHFLIAFYQIVLQDIKKSNKGAHLDSKVHSIFTATLWNPTTVITLVLSAEARNGNYWAGAWNLERKLFFIFQKIISFLLLFRIWSRVTHYMDVHDFLLHPTILHGLYLIFSLVQFFITHLINSGWKTNRKILLSGNALIYLFV